MAVLPERLLAKLRTLPSAPAYLVALSGGVDSIVLLHALVGLRDELKRPLRAVHVHHGLYSNADEWAIHCQTVCRDWSVPLELCHLQIERQPGESLEALARVARYRAFERLLPARAMLLTAHHGNDQAETILLQLLRGAGPAGLAGAAELRALGAGWLARPLLEISRRNVRDYAVSHGLCWIEDPSNMDRSFDRNYLRHEIMPLLHSRWPGADAALLRSAKHCSDAQGILNEVAASLFADEPSNTAFRLQVKFLLGLTADKQRLVLRYWLRCGGLPMPDTNRLTRIVDEVARARDDAAPCVSWPGAEIRRFQGLLCAMPPLPAVPDDVRLSWQNGTILRLPMDLGSLKWEVGGLSLDKTAVDAGRVEIRFGENVGATVPFGRRGRRSFKRLCQEWGVPPWLRQRVPMVFIDGRLAAIGDYGACEPFGCEPMVDAVGLSWQRPAYLR